MELWKVDLICFLMFVVSPIVLLIILKLTKEL